MQQAITNKYERTYSWFIGELELTIQNHPDEGVRGWARMLKEAVEYNLSKFDY